MIKKLLLALVCIPLHVYCAHVTTTASTAEDAKSSVKAAVREPWNRTLLQMVVEYMHKHPQHPKLQDLSCLPMELKNALWTLSNIKTLGVMPFKKSKLQAGDNSIRNFTGHYLSRISLIDEKSNKFDFFSKAYDGIAWANNTNACLLSTREVRKDQKTYKELDFYNFESKIYNEVRHLVPNITFKTPSIKGYALNSDGSKMALLGTNYINFVDITSNNEFAISLDGREELQKSNSKFKLAFSDSERFFAVSIIDKLTEGTKSKKLYVYEIDIENRCIKIALNLEPTVSYNRREMLERREFIFAGDLLYYCNVLDKIEIFDPAANQFLLSMKFTEHHIVKFGVTSDGLTIKVYIWSNMLDNPSCPLLYTLQNPLINQLRAKKPFTKNSLEHSTTTSKIT